MQTILFDLAYQQLRNSDSMPAPVHDAMDSLVSGLRELYDGLAPAEWQEYIAAARGHALMHLIHQDPFTCRGFYKPRGYAGDARLIDYIYGFVDDDETMTALGRSILAYSVHSQASRAVRRQRDLLADYITSVRTCRPDARVLSVGCGHLREAHLTIDEHPVADFVAIDQDPRSVNTTKRLFGTRGVRALEWCVRDLVAGRRRHELGSFDLIYAAGLYDYLSDDAVQKLTRRMFDMLTAGGTLLVANFVPELQDIGYMETLMDWHLTCRSAAGMHDCASTIDATAIASQRVFTEENGAIAFLELVRS